MTAKELGEQTAMPQRSFGNGVVAVGGLTKRELFAAMALHGLLENTSMKRQQFTIECAVRYADALLAELAKGQP